MGRLRLDLHVHSRHSPDSSLSVEAIVTHAAERGLDGFALTDHNTVAGHAELAEWQARFPDLVLVPGVEVSTLEGHLLVYGVREVPPIRRPVAETVDWALACSGVPVLAHPFRLSHGVGRAAAESSRVPAIETVNGHNSPRANRRAAAVVHARQLGTTGGSDGHELGDLGRAFADFPENTRGLDGVLDALRAGKTTAGGSTLDLAGRVRTEWRTIGLRLRRWLRPI